MDKKKTLRTVLLAVLCVPASGVGIALGFIVGCVIAMMLQSIFAPGAGYDHYSIGTPIGNIAILSPIAIGAKPAGARGSVAPRMISKKKNVSTISETRPAASE